MDFKLELVQPQQIELGFDNVVFLGVNPEDATAEEYDVAEGKTFYSQINTKRVGKLVAYNVEEQILSEDKSRIVISKVATRDVDDFITAKENIEAMKSADFTNIVENGGEFASDEEYSVAENEFQKIANTIMGVKDEQD